MQRLFREKVKKKMAIKRRSTGVESHYLNWFLALFVTAILLASLVPAASAGLWYYRRPITITNDGGALTDYQVLVTLTDLSNMNPDGSDLRFTSETNTRYDYWIEVWNTSGTSKIWVNVPSIPSSGSSTMYLWYDNTEASPDSNGAATFSFFDDFDNLDGWSDVLFFGSSDYSTSSIVNNKLHIVVTNSGNRVGACTDSGILSKNQRVEAKVDGRTGTGDINTGASGSGPIPPPLIDQLIIFILFSDNFCYSYLKPFFTHL